MTNPTALEQAARKALITKIGTVLVGLLLALAFCFITDKACAGANQTWTPELVRALKLNLKSSEIDQAIRYYNAQGIKTEDITQKQLNDYIESHR